MLYDWASSAVVSCWFPIKVTDVTAKYFRKENLRRCAFAVCFVIPVISHFFLPRFLGVFFSSRRCRLASWHRHGQPSVSLSGGGMRASATVPQWSQMPITVIAGDEMDYATPKANGFPLQLFYLQRLGTTEVCANTDLLQRTPRLQLQRLVSHRGCSRPVRLRSCVVCRPVTSHQKTCLSMSLLEEVVRCRSCGC